jgi:hypothetical protein
MKYILVNVLGYHAFMPLKEIKNMFLKDYRQLKRKKYGCHFQYCSKIAKHYILLEHHREDGIFEYEIYLCAWHLKKIKKILGEKHEYNNCAL